MAKVKRAAGLVVKDLSALSAPAAATAAAGVLAPVVAAVLGAAISAAEISGWLLLVGSVAATLHKLSVLDASR